VEQILQAKRGGKPLPPKAVLLSFDDGYRDFYSRVIPVLQAFQWPAVLAPVGNWLLTPPNQEVIFGDQPVQRHMFLNPEELKKAAQSPLIEIGAHTYHSHRGTQGNPQGNLLPHMSNRMYVADAQRYENTEEYQHRVGKDVRNITQLIQKVTGKIPRVWVWPYGNVNGEAQAIIKQQGYQLFLTLDSGLASASNTDNVPRLLMSGKDDIQSVAQLVANTEVPFLMRVAHVDLDYVYDPDPEQQIKNLDSLVQRVFDMGITTVFLQAFSDPDGSGLVKEVYFPNRVLPVRADLFNRVAWQLMSRADVKVYAWMPVLSLDLDASHPRISALDTKTGKKSVTPEQYPRLSPFHQENRLAITKLYEDLSRHADFDGILFHDDAIMSDFEDASPAAMAFYQSQGLPSDIQTIRSNPEMMQRWTRMKSRYLTDFTISLAKTVKSIRGPDIRTARNIFAEPVLNEESEAWFAQNIDEFLQTYDWTAPMAMPYMEGIDPAQAKQWIGQLVDKIAQRKGALDKTVFELQSRNWKIKNGQPGSYIDSSIIAEWMRTIQLHGGKNFGYYPDDFSQDHPSQSIIRPEISTSWYPTP
jgi:biofilm PGA synthesis lipoprotein PgaB